MLCPESCGPLQDGPGAASADAADGKSAKGSKQRGSQKADAKLSAKAQRAAEKQQQAELELLLMDDTALGDVARGGGLLHSSGCPVQIFRGPSALGNGRVQPDMDLSTCIKPDAGVGWGRWVVPAPVRHKLRQHLVVSRRTGADHGKGI